MKTTPWALGRHSFETESLELFDEYLDSCHDSVDILGTDYDLSYVLKRFDEVAYRCEYSDWLSFGHENLSSELENVDNLDELLEFFENNAGVVEACFSDQSTEIPVFSDKVPDHHLIEGREYLISWDDDRALVYDIYNDVYTLEEIDSHENSPN